MFENIQKSIWLHVLRIPEECSAVSKQPEEEKKVGSKNECIKVY
jgi:hypothetical protein